MGRAEEDEVTTLGKVELPCNGRNISVRACKAAFRQKLGSIAVREFRPVICNCRAAHYNSPFLASELTPFPKAPSVPTPLYAALERLVSAAEATKGSAVCASSLSLSSSPPLSLLPLSLDVYAQTQPILPPWNHPREGEEEEEQANKNINF